MASDSLIASTSVAILHLSSNSQLIYSNECKSPEGAKLGSFLGLGLFTHCLVHNSPHRLVWSWRMLFALSVFLCSVNLSCWRCRLFWGGLYLYLSSLVLLCVQNSPGTMPQFRPKWDLHACHLWQNASAQSSSNQCIVRSNPRDQQRAPWNRTKVDQIKVSVYFENSIWCIYANLLTLSTFLLNILKGETIFKQYIKRELVPGLV